VRCRLALHRTHRRREPAEVFGQSAPFKPSTAMNFPGLRNKKDIDDVIAYIAGAH
jgi:hypothetical protein